MQLTCDMHKSCYHVLFIDMKDKLQHENYIWFFANRMAKYQFMVFEISYVWNTDLPHKVVSDFRWEFLVLIILSVGDGSGSKCGYSFTYVTILYKDEYFGLPFIAI